MMLSWEYPPVLVGGLGRHVHALAEALARAGHEVTVITRYADGAAQDEVVAGVRVIRVPEDPPTFPFGTELLAWTMAFNHALTRAALRVAEQSPPDVVHAHDWLVTHAATTLKHHLRVPLVATVHATEAGRHQGWLPEPMNRTIHSVEWWLTYQARRVIVCSEYMRWEVTRLFDLPPDSVDVIPNGVALGRWAGQQDRVAEVRSRFAGSGPLIVFAGRLVYEKGVHDLLTAMPRLRRRHPGIRLVVAGVGPRDEELRAQARALRLGRSVHFTGFVAEEELAGLAAAADCAVVPSIYEPFGMVALEAAAAGTPLVVADVGGLRELVDHGITGLRFTPSDVAGLAAAVDALLSDEVLARRMSRAARTEVTHRYAWPRIAERTCGTFARAIREELALLAERPAVPPLAPVMREGNLLATGD
ncbi:MAG: glycosyltransferase family 4 protein [Actinobacteria bacterium]|nr:glycosyltransferase family 4 protein [Actinomycetota bacterium]